MKKNNGVDKDAINKQFKTERMRIEKEVSICKQNKDYKGIMGIMKKSYDKFLNKSLASRIFLVGVSSLCVAAAIFVVHKMADEGLPKNEVKDAIRTINDGFESCKRMLGNAAEKVEDFIKPETIVRSANDNSNVNVQAANSALNNMQNNIQQAQIDHDAQQQILQQQQQVQQQILQQQQEQQMLQQQQQQMIQQQQQQQIAIQQANMMIPGF